VCVGGRAAPPPDVGGADPGWSAGPRAAPRAAGDTINP